MDYRMYMFSSLHCILYLSVYMNDRNINILKQFCKIWFTTCLVGRCLLLIDLLVIFLINRLIIWSLKEQKREKKHYNVLQLKVTSSKV